MYCLVAIDYRIDDSFQQSDWAMMVKTIGNFIAIGRAWPKVKLGSSWAAMEV